MEKSVHTTLLGFGTVGTGVYKVLGEAEKEMIPKLGKSAEISKILVRNPEKSSIKVKS